MGVVVGFRGHARASTTSDGASLRACKAKRRSAVTSASPRLEAEATRSAQNSGGTRLRKSHLRTAHIDTPTSLATFLSDGSGHLCKSEDTSSIMAETLGPLVLNVKANVSYDESAKFHDT